MADEARRVLDHLLSAVQDPTSRHYEKYAEWLQSSPGIESFIFGCLRPEVLRWIERGSKSTIDSLKAIGGDINAHHRGIYLHGILGLDRYTRKYIGQSNDIPIRIKKQHMYFRWRRDHASLHYFAVQRSSFDIFSVLAVIPDPPPPVPSTPTATGGVSLATKSNSHYWDRLDLVLNILEMWTCLLFRSLPVASLKAYLPPGSPVPVGPPESLNIALPLDQGAEMAERDVFDLRSVKDPLLREWFRLEEDEIVKASPVSVPAPTPAPVPAPQTEDSSIVTNVEERRGARIASQGGYWVVTVSPAAGLGVFFAVGALFIVFSMSGPPRLLRRGYRW